MRRLNITLDEETHNLLDGKTNQAEIVRQAVKLYHGGITPDTIDGIRAAFVEIRTQQKELSESLNYLVEEVEKLPQRLREMQ